MLISIVIGVVVMLALIVVVVLSVRAARSRSERSDWLGELSDIRRSSLGDDEEVTGALDAVAIVDDGDGAFADPDGGSTGPGVDRDVAGVEPVTDDAGGAIDVDDADGPTDVDASAEMLDGARSDPVAVTDTPHAAVDDAGSRFHEYTWPDRCDLRVDVTDARGLRIMADTPDAPGRLVIDLPRGTLWFRSQVADAPTTCLVRTPGGWVFADGALLIVASETDWTYVMCLEGSGSIRIDGDQPRATMTRGQIARLRSGTGEHEVLDVGDDALESEGAVRRQRRLDQRIGDAGERS